VGALTELVHNLALSHPELADAPICAAHLAWLLARAPRASAAPSAEAEEWFLHCAAVVDRVSRALGALTVSLNGESFMCSPFILTVT
jgi:hypothetical protein